MANSSIHIQRAVAGSVGHNSREHFSHSVVFSDEKNELTTNNKEAYKIYRHELKLRSEAYTERTGQKLQKKAVTQLSAVVNLEQHHTLKDLEPIKAELERLFDTKVYQMAIHRDEGKLVSKADGTELYSGKDFFLNPEKDELYFDKKFTKPVPMNDYEIVKNYHAHIEMMGLDSKGNAIRQKMNRTALQQLQTFTAKELKMTRGQKREGYTKEEMERILNVVGKKSDYENTTLYAQKFNETAKKLGIYKESDKRKDTHRFKEDGAERESGKREALATQKDLKAEIDQLKAQLKEQGATRADHAQLEQINRELREQIKTKELTFSDMQTKLKEQSDLINTLKKNEVSLKAELSEAKNEIISLQEKAENERLKNIPKIAQTEPINTFKIVQLQDEIKLLKLENKGLERENTELKETKSATVLPTKGENEASKAIEKNLEQMPIGSAVTPKTTENDLRQFEYKADEIERKYRYPEEYAEALVNKHTNFGLTDRKSLIKELGKEFGETAQTLNKGQILVQDFKSAFEKARGEVNSFIKSSKMAFKDVFHKITGKSTEQVQEQRREQERAVRQEQIRQAEAQRAKEPEQVKKRSMDLTR